MHIICHMVTSLDGKVTGEFLNDTQAQKPIEVYYEQNRTIAAQAFACGRVTMEESFTGGAVPNLAAFSGVCVPREDHIAVADALRYAVAFDRRGRLGWTGPCIEDEDPGYGGAHIIEVLCEGADDAYLAYLQSIGVSYIFAGKDEMDLQTAVEKLERLFGIRSLLLEGGSILNGAFLRAGLIDEFSLVVAPLTGAAGDKPLCMDGTLSRYTAVKSETYHNTVLHLHFRRE